MCQSFDRADEVWTKSPIAIGWLSVGSDLWMLIHTHTYIALAKKYEKHTDIIHCMYVAILYACCRIHTVYVCFFERLHTYIVCMKFWKIHVYIHVCCPALHKIEFWKRASPNSLWNLKISSKFVDFIFYDFRILYLINFLILYFLYRFCI